MEFSWTQEQEELYARVLVFARERLTAPVRSGEGGEADSAAFPRELWRLCGEFGLLGPCVPERYGGLGLGALTTARLVEAFGRGCHDQGLVFAASAHTFAVAMPILEAGSEEQRQHFLPRLCSGEWIGANAITEAEAGSDVHAIRTRAVPDGDCYVLNGVKSFVTNGPVADVVVTYATTNPDHGFFGLTAFVVEKGTPGLVLGRPFEKMGLDTAKTSSIYFEDCRVPAANRLGPEGKGADVFRGSMTWERACLFAGYVGLMDRLLDRVTQHATERRQFRKPIGRNQAISHRIVDMKLRLEAARLLLYRACWMMDRGEDALVAVALAKIAISEAAIQAGLDAIQIFGGSGYVVETGIERALRDAVPSTLFSGTSEIQRDIVAQKLGL